LTDQTLLTGRMSDKVIELVNEVKLKHRTGKQIAQQHEYSSCSIGFSLNKWHKDGYYKKQEEVCELRTCGVKDTIERIHVDDMSFEQFIEKYEKGSKPVIIQGVVKQWQANKNWQLKVIPNNVVYKAEYKYI
jgi:hypothetical protein